MYTELIFGASLKRDTPESAIKTIQAMIDDDMEAVRLNSGLIFGRNPFNSAHGYFGLDRPVLAFWKEKYDQQWHLSTRSNLKNYEHDIELFLEWVKPLIEAGSGLRDMYAIVMYEEQQEPTIYYLNDNEVR